MAVNSKAVTSSSSLLGTMTIIITICTPHPVQPRKAAAHHVITISRQGPESQRRTSPAQRPTVSAKLGLEPGSGRPRSCVFNASLLPFTPAHCLHTQMPITTAWGAVYKALFLDPSSDPLHQGLRTGA